MKKNYTQPDWSIEDYCNSLEGVRTEINFFQRNLSDFLAQVHSPEPLSLARKFRSDFTKKLYETQQLLDKLKEVARLKSKTSPSLSKEYNRIFRSYLGLKDCYQLFLQEARHF